MLGPLVAYVQTPRNAQGALIEDTLEQLIRNAHNAGADAVAVLGSVGGSAYMPRSMRKKVIARAVETVAGKIPVIAGVGALTTAEVALNLKDAAEAGASGALLQPMSYQPLLPHEVTYLYEQANGVTAIPLWVYNNPATTKHLFSVDELARIAELDRVAGFKDRAANATEIQHRIEYVTACLPTEKAKHFNWGFSGETKGALVLGSGGHTWHSALAGVMPGVCVELVQAAIAGRQDPEIAAFAQQIQRALNPLTVTMTQYGGIRVAHAVASIKGMNAGKLPQPLRPLPPAVYGIVQLALDSIEISLRTLQDNLQKGGVAAASTVDLKDAAPTLMRRRQTTTPAEVSSRTRGAFSRLREEETSTELPSLAVQEPEAQTHNTHTLNTHALNTHVHSAALMPNQGERVPLTRRSIRSGVVQDQGPADSHMGESPDLSETRVLEFPRYLGSQSTPHQTVGPERVSFRKDTAHEHIKREDDDHSEDHGTKETGPEDVAAHSALSSNVALADARSAVDSSNVDLGAVDSTAQMAGGAGVIRRSSKEHRAAMAAAPKRVSSQRPLHLVGSTQSVSPAPSPVPPVPPAPTRLTIPAVPSPPPAASELFGGTSPESLAHGDTELERQPTHSIVQPGAKEVAGNEAALMTRSAVRTARSSGEAALDRHGEAAGNWADNPGDSASEQHVDEPSTGRGSHRIAQVSEQVIHLPSPARVSAKARLQNEATRGELAKANEMILLTGDPEMDRTHLNIERINEPVVGKASGDSTNYIPRRARIEI